MARQTPVNAGYTIINGQSTGASADSVDCWLEYKVTGQSVANNTSTVTVYLYAAATKSSTTKWTSAEKFGYVGYDGGNRTYRTTTYDFSNNQANCFGGATFTIPHTGDGTKTVRLEGAWSTSHSSYISGGSAAGSVALPVIARESEISATGGDIGTVCRIAVARKNAGFTHSIGYRFGNLSGYVTKSGGTSASEVRYGDTGVDFLLPESFYAQIPNARKGTLTLTCRTYSGSTLLGSGKSCAVQVTTDQDSCAPTVSGTVTDVNEKTVALTGNASVLVRFMSTAQCTITAQPRHSASLKSKSIGGVTVTGTSRQIQNADVAAIRFAATDSRDYTTEKSVAVSMIPYVLLTNNASVSRDDPTSGKATVQLKGSCFRGSFGAAQNTLRVRYRIGSGSWADVSDRVSISGSSYSGTVALTGLAYTNSYRVEVEVTDALATVTKTLTVQKGLPVFDWGEDDFRFHVPVALEGGITGDVSGVYIRTVCLWEKREITIQSRWDGFDADSGQRQSLLLFGNDNGTLIMGVAGLSGKGTGAWSGTGNVTITAGANGQFTLTLPQVAYDYFTLLSPEPFSIL